MKAGFDEHYLFDRLAAVEAEWGHDLPSGMRASIYSWFEHAQHWDGVWHKRARRAQWMQLVGAGLLGVNAMDRLLILRFVFTTLSAMTLSTWGFLWGWARCERQHSWDIPMIFGFIDPQFPLDQLTIEVEDE